MQACEPPRGRARECRPTNTSGNDRPLSFKRTGLASLLFAVARPRDASATALEGPALTLRMPFGPREIPMRDIVSVVLEGHWGWGGVRIRTFRGDTVVSGLRRRDAVELGSRAGGRANRVVARVPGDARADAARDRRPTG